jgi:hypothetical protein
MHESIEQSLLPWHDFYTLVGAAGATLIGLMFVALSLAIGVRNGTKEDVNIFVTPTVVYFLGVVVVAALAVMPFENARPLGGLIAAIPTFGTPVWIRRLWRLKRKHHESPLNRQNWLWQWLVPAVAQVLLFLAGMAFVSGDSRAPFLLAASLVVLLVVGVRNAWTFMIWIVEQRSK